MDDKFSIDVLCLFCNTTLQEDKNVTHNSGDLIKCHSCGELNDYDSVINIAQEKGVEIVNKQIEDELQKMTKNLFK